MMYKLIAIDIDDTLLNDELTVTEPTKQALAAAMNKGVTITLATGRMFASASQIAKQINLNVPIITYQGALVKTLLDEQIIYERYVPSEAARKLLAYATEHKLHLQLFIDDRLYGMEDNDCIKQYSKERKIEYTIEPDFDRLVAMQLNKMLIIEDPEQLEQIEPELKALIGDQVHITKSKANFLEIMHKEGTKGHALQFMAQHLGCTLEETIAIGDAWNDHEMIEAAGLGVAMGNATEKLKQIADYITASNNNEGVKQVIDNFILNPMLVSDKIE